MEQEETQKKQNDYMKESKSIKNLQKSPSPKKNLEPNPVLKNPAQGLNAYYQNIIR